MSVLVHSKQRSLHKVFDCRPNSTFLCTCDIGGGDETREDRVFRKALEALCVQADEKSYAAAKGGKYDVPCLQGGS